MVQNGTNLTNKQVKAIAALLNARTVTEACQAAKIGRSTLARWLKDSTFKQALSEAENEALKESSRILLTGNNDAIDAIFDLMTNGKTESIRLRAASEWLAQSNKFRETISLEDRISALEERLKK